MQLYNPDPVQQAVIDAGVDERLLVTAGPGTGKTQISAMRLSHLVRCGVRPSQILVLSFSRSAVRTLVRRIEKVSGDADSTVEDLRHLSVRTFDSWTFRILRQTGLQPSYLMSRTYEQNIALLADKMSGEERSEIRELLAGVRHVIIDEAQDLSGMRCRLVMSLLELVSPPGQPGAGFTVLGDHAQAIYRFAARNGGTEGRHDDCIRMICAAYRTGLREFDISKNYRATPELADATRRLRAILAEDISGPEKLRQMQQYLSELPASGQKVSAEWLSNVPEGTLAILTRTNGEALRVALQLAGSDPAGPRVPLSLRLAGHSPPVPGWIATLLSPLKSDTLTRNLFRKIYAGRFAELGDAGRRAICLPEEDVSWLRLLRACGVADNATSVSVAQLRERLGWPDAFPDDHSTAETRINITTIHQAKGMEFDNVALLTSGPEGTADGEAEENDADDEVPHSHAADGQSDAEEEASVLFVAVTRAARQLGTVPANLIYRPFTARSYSSGTRTRLWKWWSGWMNLEAGIPGDIDPCGFVDQRLLGSTEAIEENQQFLLTHAPVLRGHKVMLRKVPVPDKPGESVYNIHLQEGTGPGRLLGQTTAQLTRDLLSPLWTKGYRLPWQIMNLRIGEVVTIAGPAEVGSGVPEPYRISRLWLGVTLWGTGDFRPSKRGT